MAAALAVGLCALAWHGRAAADLWHAVTPSIWAFGLVSPRRVCIGGWQRSDWDPPLASRDWRYGRYAVEHDTVTPAEEQDDLSNDIQYARGGHHWRGFGYLYGDTNMPATVGRSFAKVWVPSWAAIGATMLPMATLVAAALVARRRAARAALAGRCRRCGYDLRATPERCPECGAKVVQP